MSYVELEGLLKQAMGLDAASIGSLAVRRAVQTRMLACAIGELAAYTAHAHASAAETQALIEAIVVQETWFFRDPEAFHALAHFATADWLPRHPEGKLRVLSLPCASGEEPYSIVMALLDAGVPADRLRVDACDISDRALRDARQAEYGRNSFRGTDLAFRERYFEPIANGYRLHRRICEQVSFQQANLLDPGLPARTPVYDFIFCRNLLIYFDRDTQRRAIDTLRGMLAESGVLFAAPSETGVLFNHGFTSTRIPLASAFRIVPAVPAPPPAPVRVAARPAPAIPPAPPGGITDRADRGIDAVNRLADQGRLEEAIKCCEIYILESGPSAPAYYLLGTIRAAAGNLPEADHSYRKALYLDPDHADALLQLASVLEKRGATAEAKVLRDRHFRLANRQGKAHER